MRNSIASVIVNLRIPLLVALLAAAFCCLGTIGKTNINYELTEYLAKDTMTKRSLDVMKEEFSDVDQVRVMFRGLSDDSLERYIEELDSLPEIVMAAHDPGTDTAVSDGVTYQLVNCIINTSDASGLITRIRGMFTDAGEYYVGGTAATLLDLQTSMSREIPIVMAIAVAVVFIVLLITSHAWLEPFIILAVLAVSIIINLGTNFIFPSVSYITFAVSAILQLALSIDYAIMLLHTYHDEYDEGKGASEAMKSALSECFMRISSSALTTVAGLLALLFMSFTIGFDIGLVLSKGIIISMLCVFLLMPSVTLFLEKPLRRTRHRSISLGGAHLARLIFRIRKPFTVLMFVAIAAGFALQTGNEYSFYGNQSGKNNEKDMPESERIAAVFGDTDVLAVMVPSETGEDGERGYEKQKMLAEALENTKLENNERAVTDIKAMVTTGSEALREYTPEDIAGMTGTSVFFVRLWFLSQGLGEKVRGDVLLKLSDKLGLENEDIAEKKQMFDAAVKIFESDKYDRLIITPSFSAADSTLYEGMEAIEGTIREIYGEEFYMTGMHMSSYDIGKAFRGDLMKVNIITFAAIALIVCVSFRALLLPMLLVLVIEGAIWINMGISTLLNEPIFFMSYLICIAIQMGATVDYGILVSDQYIKSLRKLRIKDDTAARRNALTDTLHRALPTVLTSGSILVAAGYIIGKVSSIYYISSIGLLLARGAFISALLVLTWLPAILTGIKVK